MSTLEGLVQSVSTTITSDLIKPFFRSKNPSDQRLVGINKLAIVALAMVTIYLSYQQLMSPKLSVGIFAQNGVYAFFSAAFVPVIFGIFLRDVKTLAPMLASITAIVVHFSVYYLLPAAVSSWDWNFGAFTVFLEGTVRNPAIASSTAIVVSSTVGVVTYLLQKNKL
jgi:sodium/pantothenate symporter